jgi:hypothetical protein
VNAAASFFWMAAAQSFDAARIAASSWARVSGGAAGGGGGAGSAQADAMASGSKKVRRSSACFMWSLQDVPLGGGAEHMSETVALAIHERP